jgi:hypothetical protein
VRRQVARTSLCLPKPLSGNRGNTSFLVLPMFHEFESCLRLMNFPCYELTTRRPRYPRIFFPSTLVSVWPQSRPPPSPHFCCFFAHFTLNPGGYRSYLLHCNNISPIFFGIIQYGFWARLSLPTFRSCSSLHHDDLPSTSSSICGVQST